MAIPKELITEEVFSILSEYKKYENAVVNGRSLRYCLRLWSHFIKARDNYQCIVCKSRNQVIAHHICRKSLLNEARLQTGNGITLCKECHINVHKGFNGKPDLHVPMDEQGGEKIEILTELYGLLLENAIDRNLLLREFYYLSESVLSRFKMLQGFEWDTEFDGEPLEQAFTIWNQAPLPIVKALMEANCMHYQEHELFVHMRL